MLRSPASCEYRRTFLQERAHALGIVGRQTRLALRLALEVELGVEIIAPGLIEGALDQGQRERWRRGELGAELVCMRHQVGVVGRILDAVACISTVRGG